MWDQRANPRILKGGILLVRPKKKGEKKDRDCLKELNWGRLAQGAIHKST
jgi:hypothetical protein